MLAVDYRILRLFMTVQQPYGISAVVGVETLLAALSSKDSFNLLPVCHAGLLRGK